MTGTSWLITIFLTMLMFMIISAFVFVTDFNRKRAKKKEEAKKEQQSKAQEKVDCKIDESNSNSAKKTDENIEEQTNLDKEQKETKNKKKQISRVYIREEKTEEKDQPIEENGDDKYGLLSSRAQFVVKDKNISKFEKFSSENDFAQENINLTEESENISQNLKNTLDKSKRLKNAIEDDDFDDIFSSHLSNRYENFDSEKYISNQKLDKMVENVNKHLKNDDENEDEEDFSAFAKMSEREKLMAFGEGMNFNAMQNQRQSRSHDEKLTLRQMIVASEILNRRKKKY